MPVGRDQCNADGHREVFWEYGCRQRRRWSSLALAFSLIALLGQGGPMSRTTLE